MVGNLAACRLRICPFPLALLARPKHSELDGGLRLLLASRFHLDVAVAVVGIPGGLPGLYLAWATYRDEARERCGGVPRLARPVGNTVNVRSLQVSAILAPPRPLRAPEAKEPTREPRKSAALRQRQDLPVEASATSAAQLILHYPDVTATNWGAQVSSPRHRPQSVPETAAETDPAATQLGDLHSPSANDELLRPAPNRVMGCVGFIGRLVRADCA
jgi:hypothetical protein